MNDSTDPMKQLAQWWKDAEQGVLTPGDLVIWKMGNSDDPEYAVGKYSDPDMPKHARILSRAPKPAWHDAVAVIAHTAGWGRRRVLTRHEGVTASGNTIWSCGNINYDPSELINPVPLIEARVTDEMVRRLVAKRNGVPADRASRLIGIDYAHEAEQVRAELAAALGVDA